MQIFSTWGTSTCSRRMIVCRGSLDFQDKICESHTQSYGTGLTSAHSPRLPQDTVQPGLHQAGPVKGNRC